MKNHVWRPLYFALAVVGILLLLRLFVVPRDFGVHERGYMYGWHRKSNEAEWKAFKVKYRTDGRCRQCHTDKTEEIKKSFHKAISCENCHGPGYDHPKDPPGLTVDRSRGLCIRCHARIPYISDRRRSIPGVNPEKHYPQAECVMCHFAHNPKPANQKREVRP